MNPESTWTAAARLDFQTCVVAFGDRDADSFDNAQEIRDLFTSLGEGTPIEVETADGERFTAILERWFQARPLARHDEEAPVRSIVPATIKSKPRSSRTPP